MELEHGTPEQAASSKPGFLRALRLVRGRRIRHYRIIICRHRRGRNDIKREEISGRDLPGLASDISYLVAIDGVGRGWVRVDRQRCG
jgi:hypothetical protein